MKTFVTYEEMRRDQEDKVEKEAILLLHLIFGLTHSEASDLIKTKANDQT